MDRYGYCEKLVRIRYELDDMAAELLYQGCEGAADKIDEARKLLAEARRMIKGVQ